MSQEEPALLGTETAAGLRRVNGWEIALWVVGVSLLVASAVLTKKAIDLTILQSQGSGQSTTDPLFAQEVVFQEIASAYGPGIVTAGLVCIALAIFLRAFQTSARHRQSLPTAAAVPRAVVAAPAPAPAVTTAESPAESPGTKAPVMPPIAPTTPTDYSAFMRPSDEQADSSQ